MRRTVEDAQADEESAQIEELLLLQGCYIGSKNLSARTKMA
jgi:hypothetical protein